MAAFDNSSIVVKVLEPRADGEEGKFYWGLVAKPAPRELFPMKVKSNTTVAELKQRIMKEKGYPSDGQRFLYFGQDLDNKRTMESCGFNNTDDPLLHMLPTMEQQKVEPPAQQAQSEAQSEPVAVAEPLPVCLMFPGQGSQYVKMLSGVKDLPEVKDMLTKANDILGYDLLKLCLEGPEEQLGLTKFCQPALFVGGLAGMAKLRKEKPDMVARAQCVAGLSLGEYTALCAVGVFSFEEGLKLVKLRGEAMQEAAAVGKQLMLSVAGMEQGKLEQLCKEAKAHEGAAGVCQIANALFPKGFACAGTEKAIMHLQETTTKAGALKASLLKTSGAFHTSLMQPAADKLKKALNDLLPNMQPPKRRIYMNVTGKPLEAGTDPKEIVALLTQQLVSPVLWNPLIERAIKDGITEFYECGPQKQLKAMMKRIDPKVNNTTFTTEV